MHRGKRWFQKGETRQLIQGDLQDRINYEETFEIKVEGSVKYALNWKVPAFQVQMVGLSPNITNFTPQYLLNSSRPAQLHYLYPCICHLGYYHKPT